MIDTKRVLRFDLMATNLEMLMDQCVKLAAGDVYLENDLKRLKHDFGYYRQEAESMINDANPPRTP